MPRTPDPSLRIASPHPAPRRIASPRITPLRATSQRNDPFDDDIVDLVVGAALVDVPLTPPGFRVRAMLEVLS